VQLVDNQAAGYRAALDLGLTTGLGTASTLDDRAVTTALRELLSDASLRSRLAKAASSTVDGLGADRVLDAVAARVNARG
jgi:spore coat polysaccharide biosynthesis predicted glycosyltransferase SpsG